MVLLGVDAHKLTHTIVAVDELGSQLGAVTVSATTAGHIELLSWASQWPDRKWAIEDCRPFSRRLEGDLLRAGEIGVRVAPKLMAGHRRMVRSVGKSDPIDALAVARAALREPELPVVALEGKERELRLLTDHRDDLVAQRTSICNRIHVYVHELDPELSVSNISRIRPLQRLLSQIDAHAGLVAELAKESIELVIGLTQRINQLEREITVRVEELAPSLLQLKGCAALSAAKLVGEIAGISRFKSRDAFAMHNGTAPIPVWSSNTEHYRLNRGGNRQINAVIYRIAITQIRYCPDAKDYTERKMAKGATKRDARRSLKRHISNQIYKRLLADEQARAGADAPAQPKSAAA